MREQLLHILAMTEADNCQSWLMQPDGTYQRVQRAEGEPCVNSQMELYDYFTIHANPVLPQQTPENQKIQQEKETVARTMEQLRAKEHKQETEKPSLLKRIWYALFGNKHEE